MEYLENNDLTKLMPADNYSPSGHHQQSARIKFMERDILGRIGYSIGLFYVKGTSGSPVDSLVFFERVFQRNGQNIEKGKRKVRLSDIESYDAYIKENVVAEDTIRLLKSR